MKLIVEFNFETAEHPKLDSKKMQVIRATYFWWRQPYITMRALTFVARSYPYENSKNL